MKYKYIRIIFSILLVISVIFIARWIIHNNYNKKIDAKILENVKKESIETGKGTENTESNIIYNVDFQKLKNINNDTVAWLKVEGTNIESTVVKASNNNFYLNHNFEKKYNNAGWIFSDYKNKLDGTDKNIVIYGHNRKDKSMFGTLKNILNEEWYDNEKNHIVNFITENGHQKYRVFSVYKIETEDYYIKTQFDNNEFEKFVNNLKKRSIKDFDLDITSEDSILTLSTCDNNNRFRVVLHAKLESSY